MATYVLPQVLVFQEFEAASEADIRPLNAFIFGGHAFLLRYSDSEDKALAYLGHYDDAGLPTIDGETKTCYDWPEKPTGSTIDTSYTKLYIDNALLQYYTKTTGITKLSATTLDMGIALADNPLDDATYPRAAAFFDRDVTVGDIVKVVGDDGASGDPVTLFTYVKSIAGDPVAATVDSTPQADSGNQTAIASTAATVTADPDNAADAATATASATSYNGHPDGDLTETYTVTVVGTGTTSSVSGVTLRVTSASGRDDVLEQEVADYGSPTDLGTRGATITFANGTDDLKLNDGDIYTVAITQTYAVPTVAAGGTYTGTDDKTYIVEVTKGGLFAASPEITVTTDNGTDFSGPTVVSASASAVAVGTKGVTITFTGTALALGDKFEIPVTAATTGEMQRLTLGHNLDSTVTSNLEVTLYIKKNIEVAEEHVAVSGQYNWEQSDTEFCVFAGIQAYDSSYTDGGELVALDVVSEPDYTVANKMYVEYRAWRSDLATEVGTISDSADLDDISGDLTPDNPLKWAIYKALQNANGQDVKYTAVAEPEDSDSWVDVLELIEERTDVYGLVPLTRDTTVLNLVQAHVDAQSTETAGRWRVAWFNLEVEPTVVVASAANSEDGELILAKIADDADTSGTQYTYLTVPANNALFETNGVVAGDTVRIQYTVDGWGNSSYSEYVIDDVVNESTLLLQSGPDAAINTAIKMEVWRTRSTTVMSETIASSAGAWANRRIRAVWPDEIEGDGVSMEGYHLCAALAALSGGVVPHQGLTNLEISGFTGVSRTTDLFKRSQLDHMAGNGVWIVTQDRESGEVYSRHAVTTGDYEDINEREEMVTRNLDSISYYFLDVFAPYIGVSNVTPSMLDIIESEVNAGIQFLRAANFTTRLGGQLIDAEITDLRESPVFSDRILLSLNLTLPYALNTLEVHLLV